MMGRLTRDPEIRYSQGETQSAVARFRLAVNRAWKREGEADADFFNCITFGPRAEFVERFLRQGTKIVIVGHIQNDNYTNREGKKVYATIIIVDEIDFAERSVQSSGNDNFLSVPDQAMEELPFN